MRMHHRPRISTTALALTVSLLALALVGPGTGAAQELPDAVEDPVEAVEPLDPRPAPIPQPAAPEPAPAPADPGVVDVAGIAEATVEPSRRSPAVAGVAAAPAVVPSGPLPFTGPDPRRIVLVLLVGSLLLSSGLVALAYGRASDELH